MQTLNNLHIKGKEENTPEKNSLNKLDYKLKLNYENEKSFLIKTILPKLIGYSVYVKKKNDLMEPSSYL